MNTKLCSKCRERKDVKDFSTHTQTKDGLYPSCRSCNYEANRIYSKRHREKNPGYSAAYYRELKNKVIAGYGSKCACCSEAERMFLTLDHVNGGGRQERKRKGSHFPYLDALNRDFPADYQVLCFNCNCAKGLYGKCPHTN